VASETVRRPTFLTFILAFLNKKHDFLTFFELLHTFSRTLAVDRRRHCQLSWTTTALVIALSVNLCRAKLTTRCDDRRAVEKFSKSRV